MRSRCLLVLVVVLALVPMQALWAGAAVAAPQPPLPDSPCAAAALVDPLFRDQALAALERLVVHAPGQAADGAVFSHQSAGHVDGQGRSWHQVSAYQANLGVIGALRVAPRRLLPLAAAWLGWQARHIAPVGAPRGVVIDHWVRAGDLAESTCPPGITPQGCGTVDAYDSTAASTLLLADAYLRHGGDLRVLRDPAMRQALEAAASALAGLTVADGLTVATPTHRIVYTMDMAEVVAGWRAWARLQRDAYAQPASADNTLATAARAEAGARARLWDARAGAWRVNLGAGAPQQNRWYPDTVAQAWPLLWGLDAETPERTQQTWRRAVAPWQGAWAQRNVDPAGFWWPAVAVAALCTGDEAGARTWVARARQRWLDPAAPFAWPFQVGDLLWLMWMASTQAPNKDPAFPAPPPTHNPRGESP